MKRIKPEKTSSSNVKLSESLDVEIQKPKISSVLLHSEKPNIFTEKLKYDQIVEDLSAKGFSAIYVMGFKKSQGFVYCKTSLGQYVLVELPSNLDIKYYDLDLVSQMCGIVTTDIVQLFSSKLTDIYTGYAFISSGGIQYFANKDTSSVIYGFADFNTASGLLKLQKHHHIVIPAVPYEKITYPSRMNTIELAAYTFDDYDLIEQLFIRTGMDVPLNYKGPMMFFLPDNVEELLKINDVDQLRSILTAGIVMEMYDSGIHEVTNVMDDKLTIDLDKRIIMSGKSRIKITAGPIRKYNGSLYRISSRIKPVQNVQEMPEQSDMSRIVTLIDVNRTSMIINEIEYLYNSERHTQLLDSIKELYDSVSSVVEMAETKTLQEWNKLSSSTKTFMKKFDSTEIPCLDKSCGGIDSFSDDVSNQNVEFLKLSKKSNMLASLLVPVDELRLKFARITRSINMAD